MLGTHPHRFPPDARARVLHGTLPANDFWRSFKEGACKNTETSLTEGLLTLAGLPLLGHQGGDWENSPVGGSFMGLVLRILVFRGRSAFLQRNAWLTVQKNRMLSTLIPRILKNGVETVS